LTIGVGSPIIGNAAEKQGSASVDVSYEDQHLDELEKNERCRSKLAKSVVRAYRRLMQFIYDAADERDLYAYPGKHCEKLLGDRAHQHSMRIDSQWRLVFEIRKGNPKNTIHVVSIENYHKG
jgi:proteic killer suppression protein